MITHKIEGEILLIQINYNIFLKRKKESNFFF